MEKILVIGASGHAGVVIDILERGGKYIISEILDDKFEGPITLFQGYELTGKISHLPNILEKNNIFRGILAIGDNWIRHKIACKIKEIAPSFSFINAVHPSAEIGRNVILGSGNVIMAGAVINSGSQIGNFCIINTKSSLDHDNFIEDFVSIAPGVTTGGNVRIANYSAICLGANIIHGLNIGEHTVVGAGSTVLQNLPSYSVAYGTPAKVIRKRKAGDKYL